MLPFSISYDSTIWSLVEWFYAYPEPPPRKRDPKKPLQVIAVGFSRSGTESLQQALLTLGYDHTYHGWDILFEEPLYCQAWCRLSRKKWHSKTGDCHISAAEFDEIIGHSVAMVDVPASAFATELIDAYPDVKVILNQRRDMTKWHASAIKHIVGVNETRLIWFLSWFDKEMFWMWNVFERYLHLRSSRATDNTLASGLTKQGIWVFREHLNAVRGQLHSRGESHRYLDWYLEDGWEPLCKFLDKPVPSEPFPRSNDAKGFEGRVDTVMKDTGTRAIRNLGIIIAVLASGICAVWWTRFRPRLKEG